MGIECSEIAVKDFFETQNLQYKIVEDKIFTRYISDAKEGQSRIEILQGDFFDLASGDLDDISDIYDRASMIALPEAMRFDYFKRELRGFIRKSNGHLLLLATGTRIIGCRIARRHARRPNHIQDCQII